MPPAQPYRPIAPLLVVLALAVFTPSRAASQMSRTQGLMVGGHADWSFTSIDEADGSSGAGPGIMVGYGFGSGLGFYSQFDRSSMNVQNHPQTPGEWGVWSFDLGVRYHFARPEKTVVPFLHAGGTLRDVHVTDVGIVAGIPVNEISLRGYAGSVGGGVQLHVTRSFAFLFSSFFTFGSMTKGSVDGVDFTDVDISVQSTRLTAGIAWWPTG